MKAPKATQDPPSTSPHAITNATRRAKQGRPDAMTLTTEEEALGGAAIDTFVTALGGREALTEALVVASGSSEVDEVTSLLLDPRYQHLSLRRICALAHLTVVDLFQAYRKAIIVKAHLEATRAIASKLLPVVEDVMTRAAPFQVPCGVCSGTGKLLDPEKPEAPPSLCDQCLGAGQVLRLPDLERQKLALELGQLVQRSSGVNVLQNVQLPPASSAPNGTDKGALESLQQVVGDLLSRPPAIVEGELADTPSDPSDTAPPPPPDPPANPPAPQ